MRTIVKDLQVFAYPDNWNQSYQIDSPFLMFKDDKLYYYTPVPTVLLGIDGQLEISNQYGMQLAGLPHYALFRLYSPFHEVTQYNMASNIVTPGEFVSISVCMFNMQ
jgi:hypothetical protein